MYKTEQIPTTMIEDPDVISQWKTTISDTGEEVFLSRIDGTMFLEFNIPGKVLPKELHGSFTDLRSATVNLMNYIQSPKRKIVPKKEKMTFQAGEGVQ